MGVNGYGCPDQLINELSSLSSQKYQPSYELEYFRINLCHLLDSLPLTASIAGLTPLHSSALIIVHACCQGNTSYPAKMTSSKCKVYISKGLRLLVAIVIFAGFQCDMPDFGEDQAIRVIINIDNYNMLIQSEQNILNYYSKPTFC